MMARLAGKRVLVTGAGSGIGRAAAIRFAAEGAFVCLLDRDAQAVGQVAAAIRKAAGRAHVAVVDVTAEREVAVAIGDFVGVAAGLDAAVVNAAVQLFGQDDRCHELEAAVWRRTVDVNLTGAFLTCKHALRAMLAQGGGGSLVLTGSPTGLLGCAPGFSAYSASKAGVHGLMRVLAADYAGEGIRVNAVVPGFTDTPLVVGIDPEDRVRLLASIPLGRQGAAEEVASMMVFLASDESRYCTGGFYMVDGGLTSV